MLRSYLLLKLLMPHSKQSRLAWTKPLETQKATCFLIWLNSCDYHLQVGQAHLLSCGPADEEVSLLHILGLQIIHSHYMVSMIKQTSQPARTSPLWDTGVFGGQTIKKTYGMSSYCEQNSNGWTGLQFWYCPLEMTHRLAEWPCIFLIWF